MARWQSDRPPIDKIDTKREEKIAAKEIKPTPETVSSSSSTITDMSIGGGNSEEAEPAMMAGIYGDLV